MSLWFAGAARTVSVLALALAFTLGFVAPAAAQGLQTSTLTGTVSSSDGSVLPGVNVTLSSPALQGERSTTSDANGNFIFRGLPGGDYKLTFTLSGFATVERPISIALGTTPTVDTTLSVATVAESITVTAVAPSVLESTVVGANFRADAIDKLASGRTIQNIAELAPGLNDNTPNVGQLQIAGSFAFDNVFLLNGVDINDNLFGAPHNLFVEDAIEEVQVLTSGISAEYGRFSGGVINAVTKRGGNKLSGSFRTDLTNPEWQDESRFEKEGIAAGRPGAAPHADRLSKIFQATLGGPILKDRLWFFVAGRTERSTTARTLNLTGVSYDNDVKNNRLEVKLTGALSANHNVNATYMRGPTDQINNCSINCDFSISPSTLVTRNLPLSLFVANYNGVLSSNLFLEAQFSQKKFGFRGTGGTSTDIFDSPFLAQGRTGIPANSHYNAPYFSSLDPEDRNNRQYTAALSYFLSTGSLGRHDFKVGGENFTSTRTGGNSQSSTGFVFQTDPVLVGGRPALDANGNVIPLFTPGVSRFQNWLSVQGAQINLQTMSFYVNDRWTLNDNLSFNLGARLERRSADTTQAGIVTPNSTSVVPRLGVSFDPKGDGQWVLQATYGHYAGKSSETQWADNTNVGTPNLVVGQYTGPAGQGVDFAPGFDPANYAVIGGSFPIRNVFLAEDVETPITKEWTVQAGTRLGSRGEIKAIYTNRSMDNFIEDFITIAQGRTTVTEDGRTFGTFDNSLITNTDLPVRDYQGLQFQASYRVTDAWALSASWTTQLKFESNIEGEGANTPGAYSIIGDRPEFYALDRHFPIGRPDDFQKHKVRVFSTYDLGLGRAGTLSLGGLYRYDSPLTFSLFSSNVPFTPQQIALNPGYANVPTTQTLFYAERGSEEFEAQHLFDLALSYDIPVFKSVRPYFKADIRNVFNKQPVIGHNTTVAPNNAGPRDALGLPTEFIPGSLFGQVTSNLHTPIPREVRFSLGFRF
jgi:hypothetical protein